MAKAVNTEVKNTEEEAETKATETKAPAKADDGMVTIRLIRDENHRQPLFVGLNGKGYLIQRGKNVSVPKAVAEIIENSLDQEQAALDYMDSKKYTDPQ